MKKIILTAVLFAAFLFSYGQDKWRTLTISNLGGVTLTGDYLHTFSASLDYELSKGWSISSWSGVNYNASYDGGWVSTQFMLNKSVLGFNLGTGVMYGSGNMNTPFPEQIENKDVSVVFQVSKRFRLNRKK